MTCLNMAAAAVILAVGVFAWDRTRTRRVTVAHWSRRWTTKNGGGASYARVFINRHEHPHAMFALICVAGALLIGGTTIWKLRRRGGAVADPRVP